MKIRNSKGFTLIELLIVVAIIGIIAAIAVPGLLRARMSGNETSAIGSMRAVHSAETNFFGSCASNLGYAVALVDLATPPAAGGVPFISPDLAANGVVKSGYVVNVGPGVGAAAVAAACNGTTPQTTFFAEAHPATAGSTGVRGFGVDQRGTIYFNTTGVAFDATTLAAATTYIQ